MFTPGQRLALGLLLATLLVGLTLAAVRQYTVRQRVAAVQRMILPVQPAVAASDETGSRAQPEAGAGLPDAGTAPDVVIHVAGAVAAPGVYGLPGGARVIDALTAAGGAAAEARLDALNLAAVLVDGMKIYVPTHEEVKQAAAGEWPAVLALAAGQRAGNGAPWVVSPEGLTPPTGSARSGGTERVNLNTASQADLERLPYIGPALAERILAQRKALGVFRRVEDLLRVPGIGEKRLAELAAYVTVD